MYCKDAPLLKVKTCAWVSQSNVAPSLCFTVCVPLIIYSKLKSVPLREWLGVANFDLVKVCAPSEFLHVALWVFYLETIQVSWIKLAPLLKSQRLRLWLWSKVAPLTILCTIASMLTLREFSWRLIFKLWLKSKMAPLFHCVARYMT